MDRVPPETTVEATTGISFVAPLLGSFLNDIKGSRWVSLLRPFDQVYRIPTIFDRQGPSIVEVCRTSWYEPSRDIRSFGSLELGSLCLHQGSLGTCFVLHPSAVAFEGPSHFASSWVHRTGVSLRVEVCERSKS